MAGPLKRLVTRLAAERHLRRLAKRVGFARCGKVDKIQIAGAERQAHFRNIRRKNLPKRRGQCGELPGANTCLGHHAVKRGANLAALEVALGGFLCGLGCGQRSARLSELGVTRLQASRLALIEQLPFTPNNGRLFFLHLQTQIRLGDAGLSLCESQFVIPRINFQQDVLFLKNLPGVKFVRHRDHFAADLADQPDGGAGQGGALRRDLKCVRFQFCPDHLNRWQFALGRFRFGLGFEFYRQHRARDTDRERGDREADFQQSPIGLGARFHVF